jgi:hypothetical protein
METASNPKFAHHYNSRELWDSICLTCYLIIATQKDEQALAEFEQTHECEGFDLVKSLQLVK